MALDTGSIPCDLLNNRGELPASPSIPTSTFEDVWIPNNATPTNALRFICGQGELRKFKDVVTISHLPLPLVDGTSSNLGTMLATLDTGSKFRLISFLSNGGVSIPIATTSAPVSTSTTSAAGAAAAAAAAATAARTAASSAGTITTTIDYSKLANILYSGEEYYSIVDNLFISAGFTTTAKATGNFINSTAISTKLPVTSLGKNTYTYSGHSSFTSISDAELNTLVKRLQDGKYLLRESDLYSSTDGSVSLISLYQLSAGGETLNQVQKETLYEFETRNLRFFAAFLAEYCFYRTRYDWFLTQYFKYYSMNSTQFSNDNDKDTIRIAVGSENPTTQPTLLQGIATQMAKLNTRMIDMKRLLNAINSSYQGIFMSIQTTLNNGGVDVLGSNSNVVAVTQGLSASADNANKYLSDAEFRKGIMDYTSEKNRYSNILLSFYAFLNIAALAAIFQLARS
jgi:hypothetical protein